MQITQNNQHMLPVFSIASYKTLMLCRSWNTAIRPYPNSPPSACNHLLCCKPGSPYLQCWRPRWTHRRWRSGRHRPMILPPGEFLAGHFDALRLAPAPMQWRAPASQVVRLNRLVLGPSESPVAQTKHVRKQYVTMIKVYHKVHGTLIYLSVGRKYNKAFVLAVTESFPFWLHCAIRNAVSIAHLRSKIKQ